MKRINPNDVVPMHCTGWKAMNEFAREMPGKFILNTVGTMCTCFKREKKFDETAGGLLPPCIHTFIVRSSVATMRFLNSFSNRGASSSRLSTVG